MKSRTVNANIVADPRLLGTYDGVAGFRSRRAHQDQSAITMTGFQPGQAIYKVPLVIMAYMGIPISIGLIYILLALINDDYSRSPHLSQFISIGMLMWLLAAPVLAFINWHYLAVRLQGRGDYYSAKYWSSNQNLRHSCVRPRNRDEFQVLLQMAEGRDAQATLGRISQYMGTQYYLELLKCSENNLPTSQQLERFLQLTDEQARSILDIERYSSTEKSPS